MTTPIRAGCRVGTDITIHGSMAITTMAHGVMDGMILGMIHGIMAMPAGMTHGITAMVAGTVLGTMDGAILTIMAGMIPTTGVAAM